MAQKRRMFKNWRKMVNLATEKDKSNTINPVLRFRWGVSANKATVRKKLTIFKCKLRFKGVRMSRILIRTTSTINKMVKGRILRCRKFEKFQELTKKLMRKEIQQY